MARAIPKLTYEVHVYRTDFFSIPIVWICLSDGLCGLAFLLDRIRGKMHPFSLSCLPSMFQVFIALPRECQMLVLFGVRTPRSPHFTFLKPQDH